MPSNLCIWLLTYAKFDLIMSKLNFSFFCALSKWYSYVSVQIVQVGGILLLFTTFFPEQSYYVCNKR